ncbi:hypothetical protein BDZ97DRAFT_1775497 [Flammula alnicola]|nr:hypothetical protein BDZ97DRAFT_1775497 [Flammula alnicola]
MDCFAQENQRRLRWQRSSDDSIASIGRRRFGAARSIRGNSRSSTYLILEDQANFPHN